MRYLTLLILLFSGLASAQVTTAKPDCGSYSIDSGETHFPDHLWVMCEESGTTLADEGSGTARTLTFGADTGAGPDWNLSEGTHGTVLDFVSANKDFAENTSVSTPTGVQTFCTVTYISTTGVQYLIAQLADNSDTNYYNMMTLNDGDLAAQVRGTGGTNTNSSDEAADNSAWNMLCVRASDTIIDLSRNGSAWETQAHTITASNIDSFTLGINHASFLNTDPLNGSIAAAWWWDASKSDAEISTIYNSGDPWPQIGMDASSGIAAALRRRRL